MRWFLRDKKVYIGPVSDLQADMLRSRPCLASGGIACLADSGRVEIYVTLPSNAISAKDLESIRMGEPA